MVCRVKISWTTATDTTAKAAKDVRQKLVTGLTTCPRVETVDIVDSEELFYFSSGTQTYCFCNGIGGAEDIVLIILWTGNVCNV